jgi:hypothetical protein
MLDIFTRDRSTDVLIFGLDTGEVNEEFTIGDLTVIPGFDLEKYLAGYNEDDVDFIVDRAKYGKYQPKPGSQSLQFSPMIDDICLIPFRLFKMGWLSAMSVSPVVKTDGMEIRCALDITRHLSGQIWADHDSYSITAEEIGLIQQKYQQLLSMPKGYLEMALRRFSRCYKYIQHSEYAGTSELDDYWIDLVIALESITSKNGEWIKKNMARRIALLLGKDVSERRQIDTRVREIYEQRCAIVHGDEKDMIDDMTHEKRFVEAEDLRTLVRDTINTCINLLLNSSTSLVDSSGDRKKLPDIIDESMSLTSSRSLTSDSWCG